MLQSESLPRIVSFALILIAAGLTGSFFLGRLDGQASRLLCLDAQELQSTPSLEAL